MRLLHTADLHLKKGEDNRLEILSWLLEKADEAEVDFFVVAGDLFDTDTDATLLRQKVRGMFDSAQCRIIVIPGNHDEHSFGPDFEYGRNIIQLTEKPYQIFEEDDLRICGVPFQHKRFSECIRGLRSGVDVLIIHGTLYDQSYIFSLLEDPETEYMPIFPADLQETARYVAMGHLHARYIEMLYGQTRVIYPGSPVALGKKCEGERSYCLLEIDRDSVKLKKSCVENAHYWITKEFFVYPGVEQRTLSDIEGFLCGIDDPRIMPNVVVRGYISEKEKEYADALESVREKFEKRFGNLDVVRYIQSWEKVISNPMVQRFVVKTAGLDDTIRLKVFEICLPIFDRLLK